METTKEFISKVNESLNKIDKSDLAYNEDEFWLIQKPYEYIEYYAMEKKLKNTLVALPLVRGLHNGSYRKFGIMKGGKYYKLPYLIHCLRVCRMLVDMNLQLSVEDQDVLLASALCHDLIEDIPFANGGVELSEVYQLDMKVYETVKAVSKKRDPSEEEERAFFENIQENILALLVKLSDRGNNVEDLYNMSAAKMEEYIGETEKYFLPMCDYGLKNYPEHAPTINILRDKILTLTYISGVMIEKLENRNRKLRDELDQLKQENEELKLKLRNIWKED